MYLSFLLGSYYSRIKETNDAVIELFVNGFFILRLVVVIFFFFLLQDEDLHTIFSRFGTVLS